MNNQPRMRRQLILAVAAAATTSCASRRRSLPPYTETFSQLGISSTGDTLLVFGESFSYVLRPPRSLVAALQSGLRPLLNASFSSFIVEPSNIIRGRWELYVEPAKLEPSLLTEATHLGFRPIGSGQYFLNGAVDGVRYGKHDIPALDALQRTNSSYQVAVSYAPNFDPDAERPESLEVRQQRIGWTVGLILFAPLLLLLRPCFSCK